MTIWPTRRGQRGTKSTCTVMTCGTHMSFLVKKTHPYASTHAHRNPPPSRAGGTKRHSSRPPTSSSPGHGRNRNVEDAVRATSCFSDFDLGSSEAIVSLPMLAAGEIREDDCTVCLEDFEHVTNLRPCPTLTASTSVASSGGSASAGSPAAASWCRSPMSIASCAGGI